MPTFLDHPADARVRHPHFVRDCHDAVSVGLLLRRCSEDCAVMNARCNDCGERDFAPEPERPNICPDCVHLRELLIAAMRSGDITRNQFARVGRVLERRNFKGAQAIRAILGIDNLQQN